MIGTNAATTMVTDILNQDQTSPVKLSGQQTYDIWKGTPYEQELMKYGVLNPIYGPDENASITGQEFQWNPDGWADAEKGISNSEANFKKYLQQQGKLDALKIANPGLSTKFIDANKYGTASDLAAQVAQSQYDNWKSTYFPAMQAARDMTTYASPDIVNAEIQKGITIAGNNSTNAAGQQQRSFARFGLTPNTAQQQSIDRSTALNKAASEVDAANRVRSQLFDRNRSIMAGSVTNFSARI